jgi:hypothetical protein
VPERGFFDFFKSRVQLSQEERERLETEHEIVARRIDALQVGTCRYM